MWPPPAAPSQITALARVAKPPGHTDLDVPVLFPVHSMRLCRLCTHQTGPNRVDQFPEWLFSSCCAQKGSDVAPSVGLGCLHLHANLESQHLRNRRLSPPLSRRPCVHLHGQLRALDAVDLDTQGQQTFLGSIWPSRRAPPKRETFCGGWLPPLLTPPPSLNCPGRWPVDLPAPHSLPTDVRSGTGSPLASPRNVRTLETESTAQTASAIST